MSYHERPPVGKIKKVPINEVPKDVRDEFVRANQSPQIIADAHGVIEVITPDMTIRFNALARQTEGGDKYEKMAPEILINDAVVIIPIRVVYGRVEVLTVNEERVYGSKAGGIKDIRSICFPQGHKKNNEEPIAVTAERELREEGRKNARPGMYFELVSYPRDQSITDAIFTIVVMRIDEDHEEANDNQDTDETIIGEMYSNFRDLQEIRRHIKDTRTLLAMIAFEDFLNGKLYPKTFPPKDMFKDFSI